MLGRVFVGGQNPSLITHSFPGARCSLTQSSSSRKLCWGSGVQGWGWESILEPPSQPCSLDPICTFLPRKMMEVVKLCS